MKITAKQLCDWYGIDRRTLTNWINSDPPCPSAKNRKGERVFESGDVAVWKEERAQRQAREAWDKSQKNEPESMADAELRKAIADAEIAELKVMRLRGDVVTLETYRKELRRVLTRVRSRFTAIPGEYAPRILEPMDMARASAVLKDLVATVLMELQRAGADDELGQDAAAA